MSIARRIAAGPQANEDYPLPFNDWVGMFDYQGSTYQYVMNQTLVGNREKIAPGYSGLVNATYKQNGIIFALIAARLLLFSEARFQYQRITKGRPGELFGDETLAVLEKPWPGGTTGDLMARAEVDVSIAGNFFGALRDDGNGPPRIKRLRPDWTTMLLGSDDDPAVSGYDIDADVIGYLYFPGGYTSGSEPELLLPENVCHYAPIPDPIASFRGMSWLQPIVGEILTDKAAIQHKLNFFNNGATPNVIVSLPEPDPEKFNKWVKFFRENNEGARNAYKTMFLGAGASGTVVGSDLKQIDFRAVQAYGETRLASAAGVPPTVIGLAESLAGSALNAGNFESAIHRFTNLTIRPLWRNFAASMERIVPPPTACRLKCDDRDVPALQQDSKDAADVMQTEAEAINSLTIAGFTPESIVTAITSHDLTLLVHSGMPSVQLQPTSIKDASPDPETVIGAPGNGAGAYERAVAALAALAPAKEHE